MKIARLRIQRFRGFEAVELLFDGSTVVVGEPRAGRTDLVEALRRVLDPRSTTSRVNPLDIHRPIPADDVALTEVEATLLGLTPDLLTYLSEYLEAIDPLTGEPATVDRASAAELGIRLCYRARYDFDSDTGEHWVDCPAFSDPSSGMIRRFRRAEREALPVLFLDAAPPLQVRAEGAFRQLLANDDATALNVALDELRDSVATATEAFSRTSIVTTGLRDVLDAGPSLLLGLDDPAAVDFVPDDGSLAGLLRALQPAASLDEAGTLPMRSHGSTAQGIFVAAESIASANRAGGKVVLVGDDFGDLLDAPSAEHATHALHRAADQVILTTRRPDVIRAFEPEQVLRLTRSHGTRRQHRITPAPEKAARLTRMLILDRLVSAITSRTVVLVEGPLDVDGYDTLSTRLARIDGAEYSFAAHAMRLVSPPGADGGITRLPSMARFAKELGFHVRAIADRDKPGALDPHVTALLGEAEAVVLLPERCAVEAALVDGIPAIKIREAVNDLQASGALGTLPHLDDDSLAAHLVGEKVIKKGRLHQAWARTIGHRPPIATEAIRLACSDQVGQLDVPGAP